LERGSLEIDDVESSERINGIRKEQEILGSKTHGILRKLLISSKNNVDSSELRRKIQEKIEEMRQKRKANDSELDDGNRRKKQKTVQKKKKNNEPQKRSEQHRKSQKETTNNEKEERILEKRHSTHQSSGKTNNLQDELENASLSFGTFDFSSGKPLPSYLARTKRTNNKKLSNEELLKKAELQKRLLEETPETEELKERLEKQSWSSAMKKALGEKVKDNIGLLRRTVKREQKKKEKSASKW